jgi:RNA-binding protein with serine-rich domain 1
MTSIRISRITNNVTKDHISEIFSVFGSIKSIQTGAVEKLSSGNTYQQMVVEYENSSAASKAVKYMNGGTKFAPIIWLCDHVFYRAILSCG